jgi:hypothetical protein
MSRPTGAEGMQTNSTGSFWWDWLHVQGPDIYTESVGFQVLSTVRLPFLSPLF